MSKEMIELADKIMSEPQSMHAVNKVLVFSIAERDLIVAALRASAVAKPVAWFYETWNGGEFWSKHLTDEKPAGEKWQRNIIALYAHPAPAAPVPTSVREALEEIASWKHDTLGQRPREPGYWATEKELNAFDRGVRMAFYRCADRASAALASLPAPEAAPPREEIVPISFMEAMNMVDRGFDTWKDKPHNAKWYARIDGTPIPNDLKVNIAEAICHYIADFKSTKA